MDNPEIKEVRWGNVGEHLLIQIAWNKEIGWKENTIAHSNIQGLYCVGILILDSESLGKIIDSEMK